MVNHVRTLLLNEQAPTEYGPADEVIDAAFRPVTLTPVLTAARLLLFGQGSDHYGRCVTLQRVLTAASSSPVLFDALHADDSRESRREPPIPAPTVSGPGTGSFVVAGPGVFASAGRGYGRWTVTRAGGVTTVTAEGGTPGVVTPAAYDGSRVAVELTGSAAVAVVPNSDGVWAVEVWSAPRYDFTALAGGNPAAMFRPGFSTVEDELYDTWRSGPLSWERAVAGAIGLSRRIDALRIQ